jgi:hypothetical protein
MQLSRRLSVCSAVVLVLREVTTISFLGAIVLSVAVVVNQEVNQEIEAICREVILETEAVHNVVSQGNEVNSLWRRNLSMLFLRE